VQTSDATFITLPTAPDASTQASSAVTSSAATLAGLVTPNGATTTYQFWYGPSTSYGSATPRAGAGAGTSAEPVTATLNGLRPNTTYHYELIATNSAGVLAGGDRTFTTGAIAPVLGVLRISPAVFHPAAHGASTTRRRPRRGRTGTTVSYTDSEAALTTFTIERIRKHHHTVILGHFTHRDRPGRNECHFTGRVNGGKLAPGDYILLAVATAQFRSQPATATFRIIR
jgi:hypothetical protein